MTSLPTEPLAILLVGCVVHTDTDTIELDEPVSGVVTELVWSSVISTGAQVSGAVVSRDLMWSGERQPEVSAVVENGTLHLSADCSEKGSCQTDHEVIVSK